MESGKSTILLKLMFFFYFLLLLQTWVRSYSNYIYTISRLLVESFVIYLNKKIHICFYNLLYVDSVFKSKLMYQGNYKYLSSLTIWNGKSTKNIKSRFLLGNISFMKREKFVYSCATYQYAYAYEETIVNIIRMVFEKNSDLR